MNTTNSIVSKSKTFKVYNILNEPIHKEATIKSGSIDNYALNFTNKNDIPFITPTISGETLNINTVIYPESSYPLSTNYYPLKEKYNLSEGTVIYNWKLIERVSAKILEILDHTVLVECLVDTELSIYEEREITKNIFTPNILKIGNLIKIHIYERPNSLMMEIQYSEGLVLESDFPKSKLAEEFPNVKLKKNN